MLAAKRQRPQGSQRLSRRAGGAASVPDAASTSWPRTRFSALSRGVRLCTRDGPCASARRPPRPRRVGDGACGQAGAHPRLARGLTWQAARFRSTGGIRALAEQAGLSIAASRGAVFLSADRDDRAESSAARFPAWPLYHFGCGVHRRERGQDMTASEKPSGIRLGLRENWRNSRCSSLVNAFVGGMVGIERRSCR